MTAQATTSGRARTNGRQERGPQGPQPPSTLPHNVEAETAVLAHCLADNSVFHTISSMLAPPDFHAPLHAVIYKAIAFLAAEGRLADVVTLAPKLREMNVGEASAYDYLASLPGSCPDSKDKTLAYAEEILRCSAQRVMLASASKLTTLAASKEINVHDVAASVTGELEAALARIRSREVTQRSAGEYAEIAIANALNPNKKRGIPTGLADLDRRTGGLMPGEMTILGGRPSMGKAQSLDTPVLLANGTWRPMGLLKVGDRLASSDGRPSEVVGLYPQGARQLYLVTFADGRSTECCAEHLWQVMYRDWDAPRVVDTAKLTEMLKRKRYQGRIWIDTVTGDFGADSGLPIEPYTLGSLIANGSMTQSYLTLSTPHRTVVERVADEVPEDLEQINACDWRLKAPRRTRKALEVLGLLGCHAEDKFIPATYLSASKAVRTHLLQGLMDGDGWVETFGAMRYGTSSPRLARDIQTLVRSLGGLARITPRAPNYTYKGEERSGRPAWVVNMSFADGSAFITVPSKQERTEGRVSQPRLTISAIEPSRKAEAQCIAVSHPDRLYVTEDYIVTHNTIAATQIALNIAKKGTGALYLSLEMDGEAMAQRLLSAECFSSTYAVPYTRFRTDTFEDNDIRLLTRAQERLDKMPLRLETKPGLTLPQVLSRTREVKEEYAKNDIKLGLLVVDYLTLLKFSDRWKGQRVYEVAELSTGLKTLARDLDVHVIAVHQLSRGVESRDDKRPQMSDLRESGQLEQDADLILLCYREEYYLERLKKENDPEHQEKLQKARNKIELNVAKQRQGAVGPLEFYASVESNVIKNLGAYK